MRAAKRREWLTGYLFILPACLVIGIFGLFPIGYAFYMSLFRWRVRQSGFIGLQNYDRTIGDWWGGLAFVGGIAIILVAHWLWTQAFRSGASGGARLGKILGSLALLASGVTIALGWRAMSAAGDARFLEGLVRTFYYGFISVPIQISLALVLAYLLFQKIRGQEMFRMLYFLPYVTPAVAGAAVFRAIFSERPERLANQVLGFFGIPPQRWLFEADPLLEILVNGFLGQWHAWFGGTFDPVDLTGFWAGPSMALITIIIFGIWTYTGYNAVIFLAGLGNIPANLYEAAEIDGANRRQQFWHITVPLLSPVTFYLTVLGFIGTFQAFTHIYVMRQPFVRDAADTASIVIFDTFYKQNNFSLAAAQSILLFVVILMLTLLQNRIFGRRVFRG